AELLLEGREQESIFRLVEAPVEVEQCRRVAGLPARRLERAIVAAQRPAAVEALPPEPGPSTGLELLERRHRVIEPSGAPGVRRSGELRPRFLVGQCAFGDRPP